MLDNLGAPQSRDAAPPNHEEPVSVVQAHRDAPWSSPFRADSGTFHLTETLVKI